ncbi:lysis system o-spanin lipoprotein Rz1 [Pseudomonas sp. W5-36]
MLKTKLCAAQLLTVIAGCASREVVVPVAGTCPVPPAPPAWAMQAPSNSLQKLDDLFSISAPGSLMIKQP